MSRIKILEITNISNQLITFGYSSIHAQNSVTTIPSHNSGIINLSKGSSVSIEEQRIELGELENLANLQLIAFKRRTINKQPGPVSPCFDYSSDRPTFVGYPITLRPSNLTAPVKYWTVQNLPSGFTLDPQTGVITGPAQPTPYIASIIVSAVSPENLVCSVE